MKTVLNITAKTDDAKITIATTIERGDLTSDELRECKRALADKIIDALRTLPYTGRVSVLDIRAK